MVGIVIVSHSARLSDGVAELAREMGGPDVRIAAVGGLDLPGQPLGTDPALVTRAIHEVFSEDGVLVLADLGSAIISAELARDEFDPAQRERIQIAPAPLVEGAVAAAVQAKLGSPLSVVLQSAVSGLEPKLAQLGAPQPPPASQVPSSPAGPARELRLIVQNRLGLHARPSALLVRALAPFQADVHLSNLSSGRGPVNAKSINAVLTLGVVQGDEILFSAYGADADSALAAIQRLAQDDFGDALLEVASEKPTRLPQARIAGQLELAGLPASPGIAIGTAHIYQPALPPIPRRTDNTPEQEWERLQAALARVQAQLESIRDSLEGRGEAGIIDAQVMILQDTALREPARSAIFTERASAPAALADAAKPLAEQYSQLDNEYLRARGSDVSAVVQLVLSDLLNSQKLTPFDSEQGVLIAPELSPAETAALDPSRVLAFCTAFGGPTGHAAILARSLGIPAVVGLGDRILQVEQGETLIVDGYLGTVLVAPDESVLEEYRDKMRAAVAEEEEARRRRTELAVTRDGRRIEIAANIGAAAEARAAVLAGADAVGLFRTEFLFLKRKDPPDEEEQYAAYRAAAQALQGRPLTIRTLDAGGDKPLRFVKLPPQPNPMLGQRGIRLALANPDLFLAQLRAIVRVAAEFPVRVLFPMVTTPGEFEAGVRFLRRAMDDARAHNIQVPNRIETGMMVEVPAAALNAAVFAQVADFFSIGTNDLFQYVAAADRANPSVANLLDPLDSVFLRLIAMVVDAAHAHAKSVGVCGELASDPQAIPLLIGLGIDELSVNPAAVARVKAIVRGSDYDAARAEALRRIRSA